MTFSLEAINEMKQRMETLERSVGKLVAFSTISSTDSHGSTITPRKRPYSEAIAEDIGRDSSFSRSRSPYITAGAESHATPPFSAYEAQTLIQGELTRASNLSTKKQAAFHSALLSLKQSLNTSIITHDPQNLTSFKQSLENRPIPHVTLIQWMLQCKL